MNPTTLWLESANEQVMQLDSWKEVQCLLSQYMKKFVDQQLENEHAREILMKLGGEAFQRKYYCTLKRTPHILCEPYMTKQVRDSLMEEFAAQLKAFVTEQAQAEKLYQSKEFQLFERDLHQIYTTYLEGQIHGTIKAPIPQCQVQAIGSLKELLDEHRAKYQPEQEAPDTSVVRQDAIKSFEEVGASIAQLLDCAMFRDTNWKRCYPVMTMPGQGEKLAAARPPQGIWNPPLCFKNCRDRVLVEQIQADKSILYERVIGRCLPHSLRHYVWYQELFDGDRAQECARLIKFHAMDSLITDPCESPISKLLSRLINEVFNKRLTVFDSSAVRQRELDILNQLYVYSGAQSNRYVSLLLPLLLVFEEIDSRGAGLVFILNSLITKYAHAGTTVRGELFDGSLRVDKLLEKKDPEVYKHIGSIVEAQMRSAALLSSERKDGQSIELLQSHELVIRYVLPLFLVDPAVQQSANRWLEVAFVGYLRLDAMFFVWDQCILSQRGWKSELELFCIDIVYLIRSELLKASDMKTLEDVFLEAPLQLFTKQIRRAFRKRTSAA